MFEDEIKPVKIVATVIVFLGFGLLLYGLYEHGLYEYRPYEYENEEYYYLYFVLPGVGILLFGTIFSCVKYQKNIKRIIASVVIMLGLGLFLYGIYDFVEYDEYYYAATGLGLLIFGTIFSVATNPNKRKRTKKVLFHLKNVGIIFLIFAPIGAFILTNYFTLMSYNLDKYPYTHFNGLDPSNSMYVSWETQEPQETTLWLGTSPSSMSINYTNGANVQFHRVELENLTANTLYYYRVGVSGSPPEYFGPLSTFRTAPVSNESFKIAFFSDSQEMWGLGHYSVIAELIAQEEDLAWVSCAGDIVQEGDEQRYWNMYLTQSQVWTDNTPFVPVIGNHDYDYREVNKSLYTKYYGISKTTGHFYYTFNWSNVQFIVAEIGDGGTVHANDSYFNSTIHRAWINQTLADGQDKAFRILMFHRNLWTSTTTSDWSHEIQAVAEDYNLSLVIFGHNHHYERICINNHRYLCLGGGGGLQDGAFRIIPESEFLNIGPSLTTITFNIDEMEVTTISEQQDVIDSFTLVQNGTKAVLKGEMN